MIPLYRYNQCTKELYHLPGITKLVCQRVKDSNPNLVYRVNLFYFNAMIKLMHTHTVDLKTNSHRNNHCGSLIS